jgi:hypothetical protein
MKTLILWILMLTIASVSNAQNVNIPDTAFLHALIDEGVDTNGDSLISYEEAESINFLDVSGVDVFGNCLSNRGIISLDGIEAFINLDTLDCSCNSIVTLNLSSNNDLIVLKCYGNQLVSLDVSKNTSLKQLWCTNNKLTSLNVSKNTALELLLINYMPNLYKVCVWEMPFPLEWPDLQFEESPNVYFITDCKYIDNVFIPDTAFLYALIDEGVDTNGDSLISYAEAEAITSLNVSGEWICKDSCGYIRQIASLEGVEAFVNLDTLKCYSNQLTSLDVSNNINLKWLFCEKNQLTSLDVSNNTALTQLLCNGNQLASLNVFDCTALEELKCGGNQLTSLDISNNTALTNLYCYSNQLTSFDVSNNTALTGLYCDGNQLTNLDVSNNTALTDLYCSDNKLDSLDVSSNTALTNLYCHGNQLTNLDVSNNTGLWWLYCSDNQLTSLDVSNNTVLTTLICSNNLLSRLNISNNNALEFLRIDDMPGLHEVCVWVKPFPPAGVDVYKDGSPNVQYITECAVNIKNDYKENNTINIYPNPSNDIINIKIENINNAIIEIYNVSGSLVFSKEFNSKVEKIDISDYSKGVYMVKVRQADAVYIGKVVVR